MANDRMFEVMPRDSIRAVTTNGLIADHNEPITLRTSGGISGRVSGKQISLWLDQQVVVLAKGKVASGGISARTSDADHGTGEVEIWIKSTSSGTYSDSGMKVTVDYISSTTGGLSAGVWVGIGQYGDGHWEIQNVDCANP